MELFLMIASMLGGLALFLYGMNVMSDTLSQMAGGGLDRALGKITKNRFSAFVAGTALTAVMQSSSATTVLTVGFVNGGVMKLKDAVGLVIGANLGTTMTAWILSLNSIEGGGVLLQLFKPTTFVPFVAIGGFLAMSMAKKETTKRIGTALVGFGVMMTGMNLMSQAVAPLRDLPLFRQLLGGFNNPFIGFIFALLITMLIQSSDATVGILQALAVSVGITRGMAIPLICGAQVGSCITALVSALGGSNNGKRTALLHLYYNLLKTIPFMILLFCLNAAFHFSALDQVVNGVEIPLFHTMINVVASIIFLPLSGLIVKLAELTVPYSEKELREKADVLTMLDPMLLNNPVVAAGQVKAALLQLAETVSEGYATLMKRDMVYEDKREDLEMLTTRISRYRDQIRKYLLDIAARLKGNVDNERMQRAQNICSAFGMMGESLHATIGFRDRIVNEGKQFSKEANQDILIMAEAAREIIDTTVVHMETENMELADTVSLFREEMGRLLAMINSRHIRRVHSGACDEALSTPFIDTCYTIEKVVDACDTVAHNFSGKKRGDSAASEKERAESIRYLFRDKFAALEDGEASDDENR